jgi:hypothetical protein
MHFCCDGVQPEQRLNNAAMADPVAAAMQQHAMLNKMVLKHLELSQA